MAYLAVMTIQMKNGEAQPENKSRRGSPPLPVRDAPGLHVKSPHNLPAPKQIGEYSHRMKTRGAWRVAHGLYCPWAYCWRRALSACEVVLLLLATVVLLPLHISSYAVDYCCLNAAAEGACSCPGASAAGLTAVTVSAPAADDKPPHTYVHPDRDFAPYVGRLLLGHQAWRLLHTLLSLLHARTHARTLRCAPPQRQLSASWLPARPRA